MAEIKTEYSEQGSSSILVSHDGMVCEMVTQKRLSFVLADFWPNQLWGTGSLAKTDVIYRILPDVPRTGAHIHLMPFIVIHHAQLRDGGVCVSPF